MSQQTQQRLSTCSEIARELGTEAWRIHRVLREELRSLDAKLPRLGGVKAIAREHVLTIADALRERGWLESLQAEQSQEAGSANSDGE